MMAAPETLPLITNSNEVQAASGETASTDEMKRLIVSCSRKGDWERAKNIIDRDPNLKREVTSTYKAIEILDRAAVRGQWGFFNEMLQLIPNAQVLTTLSDNDGENILHRVARRRGSMKSVRALVEKHPSLTQMMDSKGSIPLLSALEHSNDSELVWYLALVTNDQEPGRPFTGPQLLISFMFC